MRHTRGTSRVTYILGAVLCIGLFYFFFVSSASSDTTSSYSARLRKSKAAAANPLSPPTSAFRKQSLTGPNGQRLPPPVVHYQLAKPHCNCRSNQESRDNTRSHTSRSLLPRVLGQSPQALLPTRIHLPRLHNTKDPRWQCRNQRPAVCHPGHAVWPRRAALSVNYNTTSRL